MSWIIVWMTLAATLAGPPVEAAAPASRPAVGAEADRLIEQLGDLDFHVRTAAFKRLKATGRSVRAQLKATVENSKDAEIVYRCKQLLAVFQSLDIGEECIRTHPDVARQLKKIAATHPGILAELGGSAEQQLLALGDIIRLEYTVDIIDILEYWATRIKDKTVHVQAGYLYASCAVRKDRLPLLARHADQRLRLIKFVYTSKSGWSRRQRSRLPHILGRLLQFNESIPFFIKRLAQLRRDAEADLKNTVGLITITCIQPAKLHREFVPVLATFLDDERTFDHRLRMARRHTAQVADFAIFALHRMMGKKWAAGLPKVSAYGGILIFKTDAVRQKYIAAFRTWYKKNRDQFGPTPTTRPATSPATQPAIGH